jgi:hypothetical protein
LSGLNREFFLQPTAAAAYDGTAFFPQDFHSDCFFSALGAGEKFWQLLFGNMDNFFPSSPHLGSL